MQQTAQRGLTWFLVITFVPFLFILASGFMVTNFVFAQTTPALQNDKLPEFIEWAKTYDIKLIGTKRSGQYIENNIWNSATDEIPLTAIGGINSVFEDLKKIPSHLINTLRGNAIFFSSGSDLESSLSLYQRNCIDRVGFFLCQAKLSQKYQKKPAEFHFGTLEGGTLEECNHTYIPAGILPFRKDGGYAYSDDIFLCMPGGGNAIHEFGHIVDLNGIRMSNGRETAIGKSDEETRQLYAEYERIFGVNKLSPEIKRQWRNSTSTMPGILNNWGLQGDDENFAFSFNSYVKEPQFFRDKAAKDSGVAEKYEFLKNKIFFGKEYFEEKSVITAPAPASTQGGTPTIATPTRTSADQAEALKTQTQALQDQIAKSRVQLNEIQKTKSKTTPTAMTTPAQTNVFTKTLQRGSRGDDVKQLQEFLKKSPDIYPEGLVTGYFGPLTESAVKRFQAKNSIESIGVVGPKTRAKLNEFYSGQPSPLINGTKQQTSDGKHVAIRKISVQQTSDGGRIATGVISIPRTKTGDYTSNKSNIYLVKTDADGNIIWEKNYDTMYGWGWGQSVRQTTDGGYIVLGVVLIKQNPHIYLLKVDKNGSTQWSKTFGEYYDEIGFSVQQTFDGGYFVTARTRPGVKLNEADIHLIKTDADGNTAWDKLIDPRGQHEYDYPLGAKQASDGGFIIIEYTEDESGTGLGDTYLMKINADGNMGWRKILGNFKGYLISIDSDGGYIITSKDRDSDAIKKTKTDTDGNILWTRPVDGNVP